ncbi:MAG TPA: hypothetical protein ENJ13_04545 [Chromatiales bacterium]|nr:hypothetical protein [Chromatiales bacterium]
MNSTPIVTPEINGKWKQLCRLLISYNDFKHASDIAHFYLEGDYVVDRNEWGGKDYFQKRVIGEALNSGMIISYARPFSGNDKSSESKVPDLPRRYLRLLSEENKKVHDDLMEARNISVAHSEL